MIKSKAEEYEVLKLSEVATQEMGLPQGSYLRNSRKSEYNILRKVISNIARHELEIHHNIICKVLKKDRTSIYHYERCHESDYKFWKDYREYYNIVLSKYEVGKYDKKKFISKEDLRKFLFQNEIIKPCVNPEVRITLYAEDIKTNILTTFENFSQTFIKLNDLLKEYEVKTDIKIINL